MSEIMNKIPLSEIVSPELNDVNYATALSEVFNNINNNFAQLANHNFVKGDDGNSVKVIDEQIFKSDDDNNQLTFIGNQLKECIESLGSKEEQLDITDNNGEVLSLWDNFNNSPATLHMIYSNVNDTNKNVIPYAVSSLPYIFLDGRFANSKIGNVDPAKYTNIKDMSCILVYDYDTNEGKGYFKVLSNAFPTMYYEHGVGLCWKINGNGTGISVQGIPGIDGKNAVIQIVKCDNTVNNNGIITGVVNSIFGVYDGYNTIDYTNADTVAELSQLDKTSSVILITTGEYKGFYFGYTEFDINDNKLYAYCDQTTAINYGIEMQSVINALKGINILDNGINTSEGFKGLFVPLSPENASGVQPVHLLSSTSITNTEGQLSDVKADVVLTPVNDINTLKVTGDRNNLEDGFGNLMVDKYLYLRINPSSRLDVFTEANTNADYPLYEDTFKPYNYSLKYKLTSIVKNIDSLNNTRYFGEVGRLDNYNTGSSVELNDDIVAYYSTTADTVEYTNDHTLSIPKHFASRLTGWNGEVNDNVLGIYRWDLCTTRNNFDIDDLYLNDDDNYVFHRAFNTVYTTTINPSAGTDFMWFNGLQLATNDDFTISGTDNNTTGYYNNKYIIRGWSNGNNEPFFDFVKFVPIYDNDFKTNVDTALNINYNVNITGDETASNKNLTVHGSINCDDLTVYQLTATEEIKNIFTKDNIVGTSGIKLALNDRIDDNGNVVASDYQFIVDQNGNIKANNVTVNTVASTTTLSDKLLSEAIDTKELHIDDAGNNRCLYAGEVKPNKFGIEIYDGHKIDIERYNDETTLGKTEEASVVSSDMPVIQHNNSNIIVTNQPSGSQNLYYYGVAANVDKNNLAGTGVTGTTIETDYVNNPEFDYVKNFNMHRLCASTSVELKNVKTNADDRNHTISDLCVLYKDYGKLHENVDKESDDFGNNTKNFCLQSFTINSESNNKFDRLTPIKISFNSDIDYVCQVGIYAEPRNGRWAVLYDPHSYMTLQLYYSIHETPNDNLTNINEIGSLQRTYTFEHATDNLNDDSGYEWVGYRMNGDRCGGDLEWRYYAYCFRPKDYVIQVDNTKNSIFDKIADAFDNGKYISFYVYPKFRIQGAGQNWLGNQRKVVHSVSLNGPIAVNKTGLVANTLTMLKRIPESGYEYWGKTNLNNSANIEYAANSTNNTADVKSTTLCNDGVVMRSGDYTFGIGLSKCAVNHKSNGYNTLMNEKGDPSWKLTNDNNTYLENIPVLFYHKYNKDYYNVDNEPKTELTNLEGYALRSNVIPLEDVFDMIKEWEQFKQTDLYKNAKITQQ